MRLILRVLTERHLPVLSVEGILPGKERSAT
jgi:hypothetical protein